MSITNGFHDAFWEPLEERLLELFVEVNNDAECLNNECDRFLEMTGCSKIEISDWDSPMPFDDVPSSDLPRKTSIQESPKSLTAARLFDSPSTMGLADSVPISCPVGHRTVESSDLVSSEDYSSAHSFLSKSGHPGVPVGRVPSASVFSSPVARKLKQRRKHNAESQKPPRPSDSDIDEEELEDRRPQRRLKFERKLKRKGLASIIKLPDEASVEEFWVFFVYSPGCLMIECRSRASGIPFSDYFNVIRR